MYKSTNIGETKTCKHFRHNDFFLINSLELYLGDM